MACSSSVDSAASAAKANKWMKRIRKTQDISAGKDATHSFRSKAGLDSRLMWSGERSSVLSDRGDEHSSLPSQILQMAWQEARNAPF